MGTNWGKLTSAVESQPQHHQNGYPGEHPSLLAALSTSCLEAMLVVIAGKPEPRPHTGTVSLLPGHLDPAQLYPPCPTYHPSPAAWSLPHFSPSLPEPFLGIPVLRAEEMVYVTLPINFATTSTSTRRLLLLSVYY